MPMYDWECPNGHEFEVVVPMVNRAGPILCIKIGCFDLAQRVEISHSNPSTLIDYGFGLNREAVEAGNYDPLNPKQRGCRHRKGEKAGPVF